MEKITVTYNNKSTSLPFASAVAEGLNALGLQKQMGNEYAKNPYIFALFNNEPLAFSSPMLCDGSITPIRLFSDFGKRSYRQSLGFLLGAAAMKLFPDRRLTIGFAYGDGYYYTFDDDYLVNKEVTTKLAQTMKQLIKEDLPITQEYMAHDTAIKWFEEHNMPQTADLLRAVNAPQVKVWKMGDYIDMGHEPMVPSSGLLSVWDLIPYRLNGMLLRYPRSYDYTQLDTYKDYPLLFDALRHEWNNRPILKVFSISDLTKIGEAKKMREYIRLCEEFQANHISSIAEDIVERETVKFVFIAGPSSSGKTTFAHKLCNQLRVRGYKTIKITLDDYFLPPPLCPKQKNGSPDFECPEAMDLKMLEEHLKMLANGQPVALPSYNFTTHTTTFAQKKTRMDANTVLVIEGIHGLNPKLHSFLEKDSYFKVLISAFTQVNVNDHSRISTTDNRFLRRIVRDYRTRNHTAEETLKMMPSVLRGENLYIFPFQNDADVMINSALDYEIAVLAPFVEPLLKRVSPNDGLAYFSARRLLDFISNFPSIPEGMVPNNSLLREFIGGSEYNVT